MNSIISITISMVMKWLKGKLDTIILKRRGRKILENFKATVWKTE